MPSTLFILQREFQRRAAAVLGVAGAALLAVGTPAWAVTYYVAPGGNDSSLGTSLGTAWRTLAKVNSSLQPGDVVLIQPGSYSDGIVPARDGGASSRISYVGSLTSPGAAVVASINLTGKSYISAKGVTSLGDVSISASTGSVAAQHDSLLYVTGLGGLYIFGAWFSHVGHCTIGDNTVGDNFITGVQNGDSTRFLTVEDNVFNLAGASGTRAESHGQLRSSSFSRNVFNIRVAAGSSDAHPTIYYGLQNCTFTDNKRIFRNDIAPSAYDVYGLCLRDACLFNSWVRDTFLVHPSSTGKIKYMFAISGTLNTWRDGNPGSNGYNKWINCYFRGDGLFGSDTWAHGYEFFGNTFVVKRRFELKGDSLTFRHNTFMNTDENTVYDLQNTEMTRSTLRSNIFYATGSTTYGAVLIPDVASVRSDSNLVYSAGGNANNAFWVRSTGSACRVRPGCSWCDTYGKDCNSQWGDPQFTSVSWSSPNATPRTGSIALSAGLWPDGYAGAIASGTSVGDLTPPGAVGDLGLALISDHTIVLRWTATGDDGTTGQASAYDLRWSNQPITAANFAAATPVAVQPVPAVAGTPQSYVLTDLALSTNYYFALRVMDESGNWSNLGNVLEATTKATDTVPPAPITFGP